MSPRRLVITYLVCLVASLSVRAAVLMEDAITNAAAGSNLGSASPWANSSAQVKIASGGLTYSGLQAPINGGNLANILGSAGGSSYRAFNVPAITSGAIYYSFLIQSIGAPGSANSYLTGLLPSGTTAPTGSSDPLAVYYTTSGNGFQLGIRKNGAVTVNAPEVLATNITHLVIVKYVFGPGAGDDVVSLFINPTPGTTEPVSPSASQTGGSDAVNLQNVYLKSSSSYGAWNFDTLRVGTAWADVTPATGGNTLNYVPVITNAFFAAQGMILRGTNGSPASAYQVITSTNITLAASNWPAVGNFSFDGAGNFDSTNPIQSGGGRQFFRLLVGATNPPVASAPSIMSQPQSLTLALGANANFSVGVSGTSPLNYFWSLNTNTPIGGNSNTLSLVSVTTNDAGAYRVIITNSVGSATSSVATLTVLIPPTIIASPTNLTVTSGNSATFNITASGSATLRYQWYFNTNTPLASATNAVLTLNSVNATNAGTYSVIVTNAVGSASSSSASLTVVGPPVIIAQPQSLTLTAGNDATFAVAATGTAPLAYQWFFNTNTIVGGNSNSFTRTNSQATNAGAYSVVITNNFGAVTSLFATLTVNTSIVNFALFNLTGFGETTTGGGQFAETSPFYVKVTNALDLATAVKSSTIKIIEITTNLDLGWLEIGAAAQAVGPFRQHAIPSLHPVLIQAGVSLLDIQNKDGLTIFSANGVTIKHACFNIKNARNVIVRNLKFDEMWEWDEATKGNYDSKDYDFIDLGNGGGTGTTTNIWIDHCTFTKAYDGICDIKGGANHITFSWNKYVGDDGDVNTNSFVWQQINALEANRASYTFYNFLRNNGFSTTNIVTILHGHDKTHLMGATALTAENDLLSATFHHQWYMNPWDRLPRLRAGNVHNYNIFADDSAGLDAKRLRDSIAATMSSGNQTTLNNTYNFQIFLNGSISTENGAILVENSIYQDCITPLRNNQTDVNNPTYTGKIMALNSIYSFRTTGGTTNTYTGSSTNAPGDTYFGPVQAPTIAFTWNLPGGVLPYAYVMTDPNQLKSVLTNAATGCGSGVLTWAKTNWLKTTY